LINEGIDKNGNFESHHPECIGIQPQNQQQALNIVNIPAPNVPQQIARCKRHQLSLLKYKIINQGTSVL